MLLAIDIGNTNVKTAIFYDNKIQEIKRFKNTISIESIVDSLIDNNISYTIISSVVPQKTDQLKKIETTGLKNKYNFVIASEIFGHSKPKIEIFQETLRLLKLNTVDIDKVLFKQS